MDFTNHPLREQYSNSNSKEFKYSNSTVQLSTKEIVKWAEDLIPNEDFTPWYVSKIKKLGKKRFIELATKARKSSDTPQVIFKWYLNNNEIVK